jgi:hypothetical protein
MSNIKSSITAFALTMALFAGVPAYAAGKTQSVSLTAAEKADLLYMREEEKLARDTYLTLYEKWGLNVFSNIANSEQSHMEAILRLVSKYRLTDPAAGTAVGEYTDPRLQTLYNDLIAEGNTSSLAALKVGAMIEEVDMRDINASIARTKRTDIRKVYGNLLCGSRNHLRAFASKIVTDTGAPYTAQVLEQYEVDAIINSVKETCGN